MSNLPAQLKKLGTVVTDTGDLDAIRRFAQQDEVYCGTVPAADLCNHFGFTTERIEAEERTVLTRLDGRS